MVEPALIEPFEAQGRSAIKTWVFYDTLQCAIYWGYGGFNGYVRLPEGSIDRVIAEVTDDVRKDSPDEPGASGIPINRVPMGYDMLDDLEVHGGITFGPEDGWIGFDTGHAGDNWTDEEIEKWLREGDPLMWEETRAAPAAHGTGWARQRHGPARPAHAGARTVHALGPGLDDGAARGRDQPPGRSGLRAAPRPGSAL